jgi:parallel beta-helix repeat protein
MATRKKLVGMHVFSVITGLALGALPPAAAAADTIVVKTTIQAAVDAASPGDTIFVPRGVYHEGVVVDKSGLTIRGTQLAVLDATGQEFGIRVGTGAAGDPPVFPGCPDLSIHGFALEGLTVRNAEDTGVFLRGVDGFRLIGTRYQDNGEYGAFPRCSRNGLIEGNTGGGGLDATIYVGVDDNVVVAKNVLTKGEIGIELENTRNSVVRANVLTGNVAGILAVVLPGLPTTSLEHARIEGNTIFLNNLPNPFPPSPPAPLTDDLQLLPSGTGILNIGGDDVVIRHNWIFGNGTAGIALLENPFGFGAPDDNQVRENVVVHNGLDPDPRAGGQAGDLLYDGSGSGTCFANNAFQTDFPAGITQAFPCP